MVPDGKIENWRIVNDICYGKIFSDRKNRFSDGEHIFTSRVMMHIDDFIVTRNSVYELGEPYNGE